MQPSKPSSLRAYSHFSCAPAIPTTWHPLIFASWPTIAPTAPAAADTTTVSPAFGCPTLRSPKYAVRPGIPRTPNAVEIGASEGSTFCAPAPSDNAYSCQPVRPSTMSPGVNPSRLEATTSLTVPPTMTSPIPTGDAYDFRLL